MDLEALSDLFVARLGRQLRKFSLESSAVCVYAERSYTTPTAVD